MRVNLSKILIIALHLRQVYAVVFNNVNRYRKQDHQDLLRANRYVNKKSSSRMLQDELNGQKLPAWAYKKPDDLHSFSNHRGHFRPGIKLPNHYMLDKAHHPALVSKQRQNTRSMPIFDYMPGQDTNEPMSMLIYSGAKGERLFNTMLSRRRYPMQEPTPGQILYPPPTLMLKVKPILQSVRHPSVAKQMNLTLIPFTAHDAITTSPAATEASAATRKPHKKKKKRKHKAKQSRKYKVYRAADEVHWLPSTAKTLLAMNAITTTAFPLALASPLEYKQQQNFPAVPTVTPTPTTTTEFLINYPQERIEKPPLTSQPTTSAAVNLLSSRYADSQQYFALPVFTLGKILSKPQSTTTAPVIDNSDVANTWFVLNSRYRGHHKHNSNYSYSSKYVKNPINLVKQSNGTQTSNPSEQGTL